MGFIVNAVKSVIKTVVGVVSKVIGGVFGFIVGSKSKKTTTPNTLTKTLDPEAFKKILLGKTAAVLDTRYWEVYGPKGERFVEVINFAGHRVNAILETYYENVLGFDAAGAPQGIYNGVVTRITRLGANNQTGFAVGGGTKWTAAATNDGNAYAAFDWLPDEKKLPNGMATRVTQVIEGGLVYDPRRDSTVTGGSGTHRINDRTTWEYATLDGNGVPIGRNNALQTLWYLLGWTVPTKDAGGTVTGEMLVCGRGVQPEDINLATFIAGANACEAAGYYTDVALSTEDDHTSNEDAITCSGLIGRLIDPGGLWSYYANVDDTASIAVDLTDADILEGVAVNWDEYKGMADQFNQVRGKYINPTPTVLYQPFAYPMVRDAVYEANLGVKRSKTQDFRQVLDSTLAQRLSRLLLNQGQYQGEFTAGFNYRAARAQAWSVVRYTSDRFGWVKLFRVWRHDISTDSGITMLLKEIDPSIWAAGTINPPIAPGAGLKYDPLQLIDPTNVTVALAPLVGANGDKADGFRMSWDAPPTNVSRTETRYRLVGTVYWKTAPPAERDVTAVLIGPELSGAIYEVAVRHISISEIPGNWVVPTTAPANGVGQFQMGVTGTVNYAAIIAAGGTATWAGITGTGKPQDNADVTLTHISNGFTGQAPIASDNTAQIGATNDRIPDTRATNQPPSWYRINYAFRSICEFKDGNSLGVPGASANYYGALTSIVDWSDNSGGSVKQRFVYGSTLAGIAYERVEATTSTWGAWQKVYTGYQRPGFNTSDLVDSTGVVTQASYRTIEGIASGFTGMGALSLLNSAAWASNISGRPAELTDGRIVAGIDSSGDLVRNITTTRRNASNLLGFTGGGTFGGELTADTTISHIASGFTGQTAWAILTTPVNNVLIPGTNLIFNGSLKLGLQGVGQSGAWVWANDSTGPYIVTTSNGAYFFPLRFVVAAGLQYCASLEYSTIATGSYFYIAWYTAADAANGSSPPYNFPTNGNGRVYITATAPGGTAYCRIVTFSGSGGYTAISKIKCEYSPSGLPSPFTDEMTNGALYQSGVTIDSLQPAEANANVTVTHIASGFTGQAVIATDADAIGRILSMRGDNLVRNGDFREGGTLAGMATGDVTIAIVTLGTSDPATYGVVMPSGLASGNSYWYPIFTTPAQATSRRVFISVDINNTNLATTVTALCVCFDKNGSDLGVYPNAAIGTLAAAAWQTLSFPVLTLPVGCVSFRFYLQRSGANTQNLYFTNARAAFTQRSADMTLTAQITMTSPPSPVVIQRDSGGAVVSGQLPRTVATPGVSRNGASIALADNTSYAIANIIGGIGAVTIDNTNGSGTKGQSTIPTGLTSAGSYQIVVTVDGIAQQPMTIAVNAPNADPTLSSASMGTTGVSNSITTTSYVQVGDIIPGLVKGTGQKLYGTYGGSYYLFGVGTLANHPLLKWQYSVAGANSWTDLAAGVAGSDANHYPPSSGIDNTSGSVTVNQNVTPSNGTYDMRLVAAENVASGTITFQGETATAYVGT